MCFVWLCSLDSAELGFSMFLFWWVCLLGVLRVILNYVRRANAFCCLFGVCVGVSGE